MLTKTMTIVGAVLITATTAQAAAVVHKHQSRSALSNQGVVVGEKARASMARMPTAITRGTLDDQSRYHNGAMSAPAGH